MKALIFNGKEAAYTGDAQIPTPSSGESLVKILMSAVCNTDKEISKGYKPDFKGVMGHEFIGIVEKSPDKSLVGKRVAGEINASCGHCVYCETGRPTHCENRRVLGISGKDGCFAEYMTIETKLLHTVPDSLPTEKAIFTEVLAAALEITEQTHVKPSMPCAVIGDGRLAFFAAQALSLCSCDITVIGRHPEKLAMFTPFSRVSTEASGSYELIVEATGSPSGINTATSLIRRRGTIVMKSTYVENASVNLSSFVVNEVTLKGSRCGPFAPAIRLLDSGKIIVPDIELYSLFDYKKAFASPAFKAGFIF